MWVLRVLSGARAGQTIPLQRGKNILGRSDQCHITCPEPGVSKTHAEFFVLDDKVVLSDQNSSNGTFVNGVRIQNCALKPTDKISINDILFDVQPITHAVHGLLPVEPSLEPSSPAQALHSTSQQAPHAAQEPHGSDSSSSPSFHFDSADPFDPIGRTDPHESHDSRPQNFKEAVLNYIENIVLPGVYKLPELTEFKWVMGAFLLAFIVMVTALSVIPMVQLTQASIEKESRRRALTIARNLAQTNESALLEGVKTAVTTRSSELEEGVQKAMIISHIDGSIIAPANKAGEYADVPFIHTARRENKEIVSQIDRTTIGAAVPIAFYNANIGSFQVTAHAVILYDMGTLAIDDGRTISLFMQTLSLALLLGGLLFFFLYKLIEHPIKDLNRQIDGALKEGHDHIEIKYLFPVLKTLCDNINSALSRALYGNGDNISNGYATADKDIEAENLLRLIGLPGLAINKDHIVIASNEEFESFTGVTLEEMKAKGIDAIPDQAFQLNLSDLIERAQQQTDLIASNTLELSGMNCEINAQAIVNQGHVAYLVITIRPVDGFGEEVA